MVEMVLIEVGRCRGGNAVSRAMTREWVMAAILGAIEMKEGF